MKNFNLTNFNAMKTLSNIEILVLVKTFDKH